MHHPFFKQAKKKEYLVKSVLAHVLPLEQRPHKKVPQKHIKVDLTEEQWDFDIADAPQKKHISFGHVIIRDPAKPAETQPPARSSSSGSSKKSRFQIDPAGPESDGNNNNESKKGRFSVSQEPVSQDTLAPVPLAPIRSQDSMQG